jgi:hypothetical protein
MKPPTDAPPPTLEERLRVIARCAPSLRAAGVRQVEIDGVRFTIDAPDPEPPSQEELRRQIEAQRDPLQDPSMYAHGVVPGLRRHEEYEDGR